MSALLVVLGVSCIVLGVQAALNINGAAERWAKKNRDEDPSVLSGPINLGGGHSFLIAPRTVAGMRITGALATVGGVALVVVGLIGQ